MAEHHLATYLNDHSAGAEVALELLQHLEKEQAGTPIGQFAAGLRAEVDADRQELEALMTRLQITRSQPRQAAAWPSEKLTVLKLRIDDHRGGSLQLLEIFEALSLGVEGKRLLWRSLSASSGANPGLSGTDYQDLEQRAWQQRRDLETLRREAARAAFGSAATAGLDPSGPFPDPHDLPFEGS